MNGLQILTTRVVAGGQQNTTSGLPHTDQVAGRGGTQDAILTHDELLDTIGGTDLRNLLDNLGVVVAAITGNDKGSTLSTLRNRQEDTGDEGLGIAGLLEDLDLLTEAGAIQETLSVGALEGHCKL